eukprot:217069-Chlamydomonas_euryale.AAC.1
MVRGRKNFLPPQPLVFGFGFMFKLDDDSIARHLGERTPRTVGVDDKEAQPSGDEDDDDGDDGSGDAEGRANGGCGTAGGGGALAAFMDGGVDALAPTRRGSGASSALASAPSGGAAFERYGLRADVPAAAAAGAATGGDGVMHSAGVGARTRT